MIKALAEEAVQFLEERGLVSVPALARETWRMEMMSVARQIVNPFFTGGEVISVSYPSERMSHDEKLAAINGRPDGFTRLMNALEESREDEARLCVAYGCDVNVRATGDDQTTALHYAAAKGLTASVRLLIAAGAAVDAECSAGHPAGRTPLSQAIKKGHRACAALLRRHG